MNHECLVIFRVATFALSQLDKHFQTVTASFLIVNDYTNYNTNTKK